MGCRAEGPVEFSRLLPDSDSRILKPPVVHFPGFADGPHILAHHRGGCQQSQQPELREPAKEEAIVLALGKPSPGGAGDEAYELALRLPKTIVVVDKHRVRGARGPLPRN